MSEKEFFFEVFRLVSGAYWLMLVELCPVVTIVVLVLPKNLPSNFWYGNGPVIIHIFHEKTHIRVQNATFQEIEKSLQKSLKPDLGAKGKPNLRTPKTISKSWTQIFFLCWIWERSSTSLLRVRIWSCWNFYGECRSVSMVCFDTTMAPIFSSICFQTCHVCFFKDATKQNFDSFSNLTS